jgi:hypothetical protein
MESELHEAVARSPQGDISWVNRITGFVDRSRLPGPLWYVIGGLIGITLFTLNDWLTLGRPREAAGPFHIVLALGPAYTLGLIHLLDVRAGRALERMRPLLIQPESYLELRRYLTTLPRQATLLASLGGMLVGIVAVIVERVALPPAFRPFLPEANARPFVEAWLIFTWFIFGALFIHTVHQLRLIDRIYTLHIAIDLDHYQMLFPFSTVSALTAIGLLVIPYAWVAAVPNLLSDPAGYTFGSLFPIFALISFVWPLIGVHNLIVQAKNRALYENGTMLKDIRERLFEKLSSGPLDGASDLHQALSVVRAEREILLHVPTWPWQPGTPRSVVAALLLPLVVWLMQQVLEKVLIH